MAKTQITHLQQKLKSHVGFMTVNINTRRRASPGFREGAHIIAIYLGGLFALLLKFSDRKGETCLDIITQRRNRK